MFLNFLDSNLQKVRKYLWHVGTRLGTLIRADTRDEFNLLEEFLQPPTLSHTIFRHAQ